MVYQVLARKWRPKTFSEVIGQDHIARTLQNSVLQQKVAHAYLFTGTRGVGKTTIARIFAKAIRCENLDPAGNPCLECNSCKSIDQSNALDYVEIDGASNNSVDDVRELIENAQYLPTSGKFKVYVVDEVHMLSTSAFNALLKTLEEPPSHVVFIFATTDPHKLLGTVLSRCQRFDFKHVTEERLAEHVKYIAEQEGISFDNDESVKILARQGNGSVRDTLSLMDQAMSLSAGQSIDEQTLLQSLGLARPDAIKDLAAYLLAGDGANALKVFDEITRDSVELQKFSNQILDRIFAIIESIDDVAALSKLLPDAKDASSMDTAELLWIYEVLLKDFEWALQSFDPLRSIRFALLKICKRAEIVGQSQAPLKKKSTEHAVKPKEPVKGPTLEETVSKLVTSLDEPEIVPEPEAAPIAQDEVIPTSEPITPPISPEEISWDSFLKMVRGESQAMGMNLERARLMSVATKGTSEVVVAFTEDDKIFQDFLTEPENHKQLNALAGSFFGTGPGDSKVTIKTIDNETKERESLYSNVEIEEKKISDLKQSKERSIRENKFVQEAQSLFNSEISKIILNDDEK